MKIFLDSDVVISSLISQKGASHQLIQESTKELFISSLSYKELILVAERLNIQKHLLDTALKNRVTCVELNESIEELKEKYLSYTLDPYDCHIIAGAHAAKVSFLVTYNIKHFKIDNIKKDFDIVIITPGKLLQHLRSTSYE